MSAAASVASFYQTWNVQPIWFRNGANTAAIAELTAILQRAPFDGFPEGPQLAAQVQAAAAQAASGNPQAVTEALRRVAPQRPARAPRERGQGLGERMRGLFRRKGNTSP